MSLLSLILFLCALGFGLYMLNRYAPLDGKIKQVINVVVVVVAVIVSSQAFGVCGHIGNVQVPQLR